MTVHDYDQPLSVMLHALLTMGSTVGVLQVDGGNQQRRNQGADNRPEGLHAEPFRADELVERLKVDNRPPDTGLLKHEEEGRSEPAALG